MNLESLTEIVLPSRAKNLTGKRQGSLTFLKPAEKRNNRIYWWVKCDCGNIDKIRSDALKDCCAKCSKKKLSERQKQNRNCIKDLTGQKFHRLTVLYPTKDQVGKGMYWHCKCECGAEIDVISSSLMSGNTKSCGCLKREKANFNKLKVNLIEKRFGKLTVIKETEQRKYDKVVWECRCDCGNIVFLNTTQLTQGNNISCGCQKVSFGAQQIEQILKENQLKYIKEYPIFGRIENHPYRFDFAILDSNNNIIKLIEFDGEQHYRSSGGWNSKESLMLTQARDKEKNQYALSHNIPLVRIPYWERNNISLEMIMGDKYLIAPNI